MIQVVLDGFQNMTEQYLVKPDWNWCSCGIWQDNIYPCRHACAYFKRILKLDYELMVSVYVSKLYKYGSLQKLYKNNIRVEGIAKNTNLCSSSNVAFNCNW